MDKTAKASLIQKYQDNDSMEAFLGRHYVDNILMSAEFGSIDFFSPTVKKDYVVSDEKPVYDDCLAF